MHDRIKKAIAFFLLVQLLFFAPVSVSMSVQFSNAEETGGGSAESGSGAPEASPSDSLDQDSQDTEPDEPGSASDSIDRTADSESADSDEGAEAPENSDNGNSSQNPAETASNDAESAGGGNSESVPGNSSADAPTPVPAAESGGSDEESISNGGGGAVSAEAVESNGTSTEETSSSGATGNGGNGGISGDGGNGGTGGEGGEGGQTGGQSATSTSSSNGGAGGDGGRATTTATTTGSIGTTGATATTTATATPTQFATSTAADVIKTGDAIANANLLNVLNTNLVNSYGELLFLSNMFAKSVGKVDFRKLSLFGLGNGFFCVVCTGSSTLDLELYNRGYASTTNDITAHASTGANTIDTLGTGYIGTGNAYAAGNIINFVNNNLVDSNYMFLTYNNFGDWGGDIVFPNAEAFLSVFGSNVPAGFQNVLSDVRNRSEVELLNDLEIAASTGDNDLLSASGVGQVNTGSSSTALNTLNLLNSNLIGGSSMNILFKVHGSWSGKVYGLPPGVEITQSEDGFTLSYETVEAVADALQPRDESLEVTNKSDALIKNRMDLSARTGNNDLSAEAGGIDTGDAYAAGNVINVANTNMIGRNMFWAIVNIFGDWDGDLTFGKPDLWVGGHAELEVAPLRVEHSVTYHLTVMNNGDVAAEDSVLTVDMGYEHLEPGDATIRIGSLRPGESRSYEIKARLSPSMPHESASVTSVASVRSSLKDDNEADNEEQITFSVDNNREKRSKNKNRLTRVTSNVVSPAASSTAARASSTSPLMVTKTHDSPLGIESGRSVDYTVTVYNDSDSPLYDAKLADRLSSGEGILLNEEVWDLGTIAPREEITLTYTVYFNSETPSGVYENKVRSSAFIDESRLNQIWSNVAAANVTVRHAERAGSLPVSAAPISDAVATTAEEVEVKTPILMEAHAAGGEKSLLAAAFFATPTGKQLTIFTLVLAALAIGVIYLRRRLYAEE